MRPSSRRALLALLLLLPLAGIGSSGGCRSPELSVAGAAPGACADCHPEVAAEWAGSAHARAWTSAEFQRTADPSCFPCHAPAPLQGGGPLVARDAHRERGVDCQACHLDPAGALVGPFRADPRRLTEAHPVRRDYFTYRTSRLCARCHETTREEAEELQPLLTGIALSCQECHMPAVTRKITQGGDPITQVETAISHPRLQRQHGFGGPAAHPEGHPLVEATWTEEPDEAGGRRVAVRLASRIPHRLPTGEQDRGAWVVSLAAQDAAGAELARRELRLGREDGTGLAPGAPKELQAALPPGTSRLVLLVSRADGGRVLLREERPAGE